MKTAVLQSFGHVRRAATAFVGYLPKLERRHYVALAAAVPVVFMGPYVVPFMLSLVFFAATVAVYINAAMRAGVRPYQAALPVLGMLPFAGLMGPVDKLPNIMQIVSHLFPVTYIVEGVRTLATYGAFDAAAFVASVMLTSVYLFFIYLWTDAQKATVVN